MTRVSAMFALPSHTLGQTLLVPIFDSALFLFLKKTHF